MPALNWFETELDIELHPGELDNDFYAWLELLTEGEHGTTVPYIVAGESGPGVERCYSYNGENLEPGDFRYLIRVVGNVTSPVNREVSGSLPDEVELTGIYPNPFNSVATIQLKVPVSQVLEFDIFDILGRRVMKIGKRIFSRGIYQLQLDASRLGSGVYFVRLTSKQSSTTAKIVLLK